MTTATVVRNAVLAVADGAQTGDLLVLGDRIAGVGRVRAPRGAREHDVEGLTVAPGLIDLQVNGFGGHDLQEATPRAAAAALRALARAGCTAALPTAISAPASFYGRFAAAFSGPTLPDGARVLGLHLEGPYLHPERAGAHAREAVRAPDADEAAAILDVGGGLVRLWTLAPELDGADRLVELLLERGVVVAAGHTGATYAEATRAFGAGVTMVTHVFNAMPEMHHREPGVAGAALAHEDVRVGLIADGVHVHPAMVALAARAAGDRLVLVTDAVAAAGMPDGRYALAGRAVHSASGRVTDESGRLAGSALSPLEAVRNLADWTGGALTDVLPAMTSRSADAIGRDDLGRIAEGALADLVVLTPQGELVETWIGGRPVYDGGDRR